MAAEQRKAYQRQPARAVLLDLSPPIDSYTCMNIRDALTSTISIILQIHGVPCLTHLSIMILETSPKCVFPLQTLKGNLQRISVALKAIGSEMQANAGTCGGCVVEGIQQALEQFHRLTQNSKQNISVPSQLEITLVTCRDELRVREMLVKSSDRLKLEHLRKITVVCVSDPDRMARQGSALLSRCDDSEKLQEAGTGPSQMTCSQADLGMSMLDTVCTENDAMSLSNIFKPWLLDCSTDIEHLHLFLPSCLGDTPITLKCDLQGSIIDPLCLANIGKKFALTAVGRPPGAKVSTSALSPPLPLYKLRAEALVEPEGVCESVLFGMPIMLRPTACWRLDWEELESNQQTYTALCHLLQNKGKYLLTAADSSDISPRFLILPSPAPSLHLMIKSIAVQEIMMPFEAPPSDDRPSQDVLNAVEHCLDMLEVKTSYNPLTIQSNLHQALSITFSRRGPLSKGPRAFSSGFQESGSVSSRVHESRSLGPRKQYSNTARCAGK